MVLVRWLAAAFALLQILAYDDLPYPEHVPVFPLALAAVGVLVAGNALIWAGTRRVSWRGIRPLAVAGLALDVVVAGTIVWLWAFDPGSALWAVLFILPLEGAIKFQLAGAIGSWLIVTALYVGREFWGDATYPGFNLQWNSITFRMGIGGLIALVAGLMGRNLTQQKALVEDALYRLWQIDRLRAGLVSTLAHDVRNPLAAIRGTIRTLLSPRIGRMPQSTRKELLRTADRQAERLERLATDLLDLARLERGRLELRMEDVRLSDVVADALSFVEAAGSVRVHVDPELTVRADPGRLEQIVVNLTTNAVRYGQPPVELTGSRHDGEVVISVRDHGDGVPLEERATLFEPFRPERQHSSVGFGLAIVRALAEAHGGGATYREAEGGGACFVVRIPVGGPPEMNGEGSPT